MILFKGGKLRINFAKRKTFMRFKRRISAIKGFFRGNQLKLSGLEKDYENLKSNYHQLEVGNKKTNFLVVYWI